MFKEHLFFKNQRLVCIDELGFILFIFHVVLYFMITPVSRRELFCVWGAFSGTLNAYYLKWDRVDLQSVKKTIKCTKSGFCLNM